MAKNRNKQRANRRKFSKADRVAIKTESGAKDTTPFFAMMNITKKKHDEPRYF